MIKIRKCKELDLKDIFEVYSRSRNQDLFLEKSVSNAEEFIRLIDGEEIFVAEIKGKLTGFLSVYREQSFIHHLYVLPEFQRQGIGKALLEVARNKYEHPLSLKCEKVNKPAVSFYKRFGWKIFKTGSEIDGTEYILMTLDFN